MTSKFGFVSTYPPTICGLATFNAALFDALVTTGADDGFVVRVVDKPQPQKGRQVVTQLVNGDLNTVQRSVGALNQADLAIVQHEYGIYGGTDGEEVLSLLAGLKVPSIVVLHTVLAAPSEHEREVLESVVSMASAVVVMSTTARDRLQDGYSVDLCKVNVIPHGTYGLNPARTAVQRGSRPTILTWGLIGPGKGIEWGIDAMTELRDLTPRPRYVIAGQTHPKVLAFEGEKYRNKLVQQISELGLTQDVVLDRRYRDTEALADLVASADVVLLPYDSTQQVTSGVLTEAVAALKPIVATTFPHAVEMLGEGGAAGILVPHQDPTAIGRALREILSETNRAAWASRAASGSGSSASWPIVAQRYRELARKLTRTRVAA